LRGDLLWGKVTLAEFECKEKAAKRLISIPVSGMVLQISPVVTEHGWRSGWNGAVSLPAFAGA